MGWPYNQLPSKPVQEVQPQLQPSEPPEEEDWALIPDAAPVKFDSGEHADIPSECSLKFKAAKDATAYSGKSEQPEAVLKTIDIKDIDGPKTINLTFAKCIAVAGDFYVYEKEDSYVYEKNPDGSLEKDGSKYGFPICYAKSFKEQVERVRGGVANMTGNAGDLWPTKFKRFPDGFFDIVKGRNFAGLAAYLSGEMSMVERVLDDKAENLKADDPEAEKKGVHNISVLWSTYDEKIGGLMNTTDQVARFTDGGYGDILMWNVDHFGEDAWAAYRAAHSEALRIAKDANGDEGQLKVAYLHDAFGLHYLSDQFAAGHTRCPRVEMNWPSLAGKISAGLNAVTGLVYGCLWDKMTQITHDEDNAVGLRVSNLNGDQWIAFGDKQYFAAPNRINRLKSIECVQASIDEIYDTWLRRDYPPKVPTRNGQIVEGTNEFAALKIAPIPINHTIQEHQVEKDGNPSSLWVTERNPYQQDQRMLERKEKAPPVPPSGLPPPACKTSTIPRDANSANGYWFLRRGNAEDATSFDYHYGYPGYVGGKASSDVAACEGSDLFQYDRIPKETRVLELLAGGFLQIQEYPQDATKVNYAVNVWGPVQVPIKYIKGQEVVAESGKQFKTEYWKQSGDKYRQLTFTWRGRREGLAGQGETYTDDMNKTFRWKSWTDPLRKKIVLLKFSYSKSANAILVRSWSLDDNDPKAEQQFAQYETMKRLEFGAEPVIKDAVLRSDFQLSDWSLSAHVTRFFIFPFREGSDPSKPDIVGFSWKLGEKSFVPMITVVATDAGLTNPTLKIAPSTQPVDPLLTELSGFIKRFEDINNKPMILFTRAVNRGKDGVLIQPQIFEQKGNEAVTTQYQFKEAIMTPAIDAPHEGENSFYQILVGDTRRSGHREMVTMSGGWLKDWYISAWELSADSNRRWCNVSNDKYPQQPIKKASNISEQRWNEIHKDQYWYEKDVKHKFCALIPNEHKDKDKRMKSNGLNVLLVSVYKSYEKLMTINFRTFVKDGTWTPVMDETNQATGGTTSATSGGSGAGGASKPVLVRWEDGTETTVPASYFIPPSTDYQGKDYMQIIRTPDKPANDKLRAGDFVVAPVPYKWQSGWTDKKGRTGAFKYTSSFKPDAPRKNYGAYEATASNSMREDDGYKCRVQSFKDDNFTTLSFWRLDPRSNIAINDDEGNIIQLEKKTGWNAPPDGRLTFAPGPAVAEYFYDTASNRAFAILYKLSLRDRYRITNPGYAFQLMAEAPPAGSAVPVPPINAMPTVNPKPTPVPRPHTGWTEYYDCFIREPYVQQDWGRSKKDHFHDMGWRLCRVASLVNKIPMYGVMNIFSYHGVLGCRVFAPREPGEYDKWVLRGFAPYMGQHSIGTGYDSTGRWNDNISELSWGATEDFHDINYWNPKANAKSWHKLPTQVEPDTMYKRGFEAKKPSIPK